MVIVPALVTEASKYFVPGPLNAKTPPLAMPNPPPTVPPVQFTAPLETNAGEMLTNPFVMLRVSPAAGTATGNQFEGL
jgi:hypothetical protein